MTSQTAKTSRLARVYYAVIVFMVIIWIIVAAKFSIRNQWRSATASRIIASIRATFPNFCTDGQVLAETHADDFKTLMTDHDNIWGIKCDSWIKAPNDDRVLATQVSLDDCTTIRPLFGMRDKYNAEFEAINKSNGQKLAFCP